MMKCTNSCLLSIIVGLVKGTNNTNDTCTLILQGSTVINEYEDYYLNFTGLNISDKEITFDTCSPLTQFDILLNIYDKNKDNIIAFCDDVCDNNTCLIGDISIPFYPIWTLNLNDFDELVYIFNINGGKPNSFGNYYIKVIYPCAFDKFIYKNIYVSTPKSKKLHKIVLVTGNILFWIIFACMFLILAGCWAEVTHNIILNQISGNNHQTSEIFHLISGIIFTALVACVSMISSLALSDAFGLDSKSNGTIVIMMGSLTLLFSLFKYLWRVDFSATKNEEYKLVVLIFYGTIVKAGFDIIQGIVAIKGKEYSELSVTILVFATWLGVSEEIIEGTITIIGTFNSTSATKRRCLKIINTFISLAGLTECYLGIYLLSTFGVSIFSIVCIIFQLSLLLLVIAVIIYPFVFGEKLTVLLFCFFFLPYSAVKFKKH